MSCEQVRDEGSCEWVQAVLGWCVIAGPSGEGGGSREKDSPVTYEGIVAAARGSVKKMKC